ncbi:molybdate ABC transporter substrate-binding protein [Clostridium sp. CCUG 7971]|uniref:molybdate ABC transporter substrate-binding protein n=1 Tax=Clostridium sp. CCUG 7971 TaxID=2811414 RepID=UPI001ABAD004|nr:molybdate ABC transporter substrate-binding protein [Clostridium sp. CCUG 7971]MBO3443569.1 molybdate ABC transporter substrate-binding protein [Clostridium sp. CCUG 7971]
MKNIIKKLYFILPVFLLVVGCQSKNTVEEINISAAASLKEVMGEIKTEYESKNKNINLTINYGSSGSLKQQIEQGAPCDIFISAGQSQVDDLDKGGFLVSDTVKEFTRNKLALIAPKDGTLGKIDDLTTDKIKHIGVGYPDSVPAGKYADEVLNSLNLKEKIKDKLTFGKDVKEVLAWTSSGNADAGFVYISDTVNNDSVKVIEIIDEKNHSPIIYPIAITKSSKRYEQSKKLEKFLLSEDVKKILNKYGYN